MKIELGDNLQGVLCLVVIIVAIIFFNYQGGVSESHKENLKAIETSNAMALGYSQQLTNKQLIWIKKSNE